MNRKFYYLLLALFASCTLLHATDKEELKKEINKIKKSSLYLYAETTMEDKEMALHTAMEMLQKEALQYIQSKKKKDNEASMILTNVSKLSTTYQLERGNMFRAFVYVKKSDVLTPQNAVVTDPGEIKEAEIKAEKPHTKKVEKKVLPEAILRMLALEKFDQIEPCLIALKRERKILSYDRYANLDNPDEYVLVIFNRQEEVVAVLSPGEVRTNYKTNESDSVKNYNGCGAVGVKLNK